MSKIPHEVDIFLHPDDSFKDFCDSMQNLLKDTGVKDLKINHLRTEPPSTDGSVGAHYYNVSWKPPMFGERGALDKVTQAISQSGGALSAKSLGIVSAVFAKENRAAARAFDD